MKTDDKVYHRIFAALGGQIGIFLFGFLSQIIVARSLGPSGKGSYSLILLAVNVVFNLTHLSIGSANAHFTGRKPHWRGAIIGNSLVSALSLGVILATAGYLFGENYIPKWMPGVEERLIRLTLLALPALLIIEYFSQIILGLNRVGIFSGLWVTREGLYTAGIGIFAIWGILSVSNAIDIWIGSVAVTAILSIFLATRGNTRPIKFNPHILLKMGKFSLQSHIANLSSFLRWRLDLLVMAHYLDTEAIGWYSVAMAIAMTLWWLPSAVAQVLIPHISALDGMAGNSLTPKLSRISLFFSGLAGLGIILIGLPAVRFLFGRDFTPAFPALAILVPGMVIFSIGKLLAGDLLGRGKPQYAMWISVIGMIVSLISNLILVPIWGIIGASIAASINHAMVGLLFLYQFLKETSLPPREAVMMKREDWNLFWRVFTK